MPHVNQRIGLIAEKIMAMEFRSCVRRDYGRLWRRTGIVANLEIASRDGAFVPNRVAPVVPLAHKRCGPLIIFTVRDYNIAFQCHGLHEAIVE